MLPNSKLYARQTQNIGGNQMKFDIEEQKVEYDEVEVLNSMPNDNNISDILNNQAGIT